MISYKTAKKFLRYNSDTGKLYWIQSPANWVKAGRRAGFMMQHGYRMICFRGVYHLEHRVAWLLKTGKKPKGKLDHRNGERADNRWKNLRLATHAQNQMNRKRQVNNTSGFKGVCWHEHGKRWVAMIEKSGHQIWLGSFSTPEKAHNAYIIAAKKHFGEFAHAG